MSYNNLFNPKYYAWRRNLKSDVDENGDRDVEQFKNVEDIARWKFKDNIDCTVTDCTCQPLHFYYWGYKTTGCPVVIDSSIKKQYRFKKE